jgi:hypothetical protein
VKTLPPDLDAAKQAIALVRQRKSGEATALAASIGDPVAQKLVEWALLRSEAGPDSNLRRLQLAVPLAEHPAAAPARRGAAWLKAARCRFGTHFLDREPTSARTARARTGADGRR